MALSKASQSKGNAIDFELTRKSRRALNRRMNQFNSKIKGTIMRRGLMEVGRVMSREVKKGVTASGGSLDRAIVKRIRTAIGYKAWHFRDGWGLKVGANVNKKGDKFEPMSVLFVATKGGTRYASNWMGMGISHSTGQMNQAMKGLIPMAVERSYQGGKVERAFIAELDKQIKKWNAKVGK